MTTNALLPNPPITPRQLDPLAQAVLAGAGEQELLATDVPETYTAAHLLRDEENMFRDGAPLDVRSSIHVGQVPMPELAPDEVLIAVQASAENFNTVWSGLFLPIPTFRFLERTARDGNEWDKRHNQPYHVLGSDAAGVIVRMGSLVRKWKVGDRVAVHPAWVDPQDVHATSDGSKAENQRAWGFESNFGGLGHYAIACASQLVAKPAHLTWEESACNQLCGMTAYRMLVSENGARMQQGDIVVIWGATGGLGSFAVQLVKNGGGIAVGVVSSERKAALAERLGCDLVIRRDQVVEEDLSGLDPHVKGEKLGKAIGKEVHRAFGDYPNVIFEHVGQETFAASVVMARRAGRIVTCGSSTGFNHVYDNRRLWMHFKRIIGSHGANGQEVWEAAQLIDRGQVIPPLSRVFPLEQAGEATYLLQTNQHVGKVGVLCLAEHEGTGIEDPDKRAEVGEDRLGLFREFA